MLKILLFFFLGVLCSFQARSEVPAQKSKAKLLPKIQQDHYRFDDWRTFYLVDVQEHKMSAKLDKYVEGMERTAADDWQKAYAKISRIALLVELKQFDKAMALSAEIVNAYAESDDPRIIELVATALVNKGVILGLQDRQEDAIKQFDELVSRYGNRSEAGIAEWAAKALVNKGVILGQKGQ